MTSRALENQKPAPIAHCKCGRDYTRGEYAALSPIPDAFGFKRCHCGLPVVKVATVTLAEITQMFRNPAGGED